MPTENIKVAVRVRGFNDRERDLKSKCIVEMNGNQTTLKNIINDGQISSKDAEKKFAFDYSYWSFDGYEVLTDGYYAPQPGSKYVDQKKVFDDLGQGILTNAFDGFNSSLFAYGQTGSGKSYSIIGYGANRGVVPQLCEKLFEQIKIKKEADKEIQFEVTFSMIEIYNEIVRDLLCSKPSPSKEGFKGLSVHEKPGRGFYILEKDLKPTPVFDYQSIQKLMEKGNANRIIAETKMNANSSRAHTIVELIFKQTFKNESGNMMQRQSIIDLIDLAGSERADKSGTNGDRFKEAFSSRFPETYIRETTAYFRSDTFVSFKSSIAINLSLTCLGNCIAALASQSTNPNIKIPYRDSILTKLLMNALGGNSKTVMIAAISPSENNYAETLSTLRYADRAKQIKCNAKINEDPKDKIIRQLQEEINNLKKSMKSGVIITEIPADLSQKEYEKAKKEFEENAKKQIEENEKQMEQMKKTYEQKLSEALALAKTKENDQSKINEKAKICPHLSNISLDPMLTGSLKHLIEFGPNKKKLIIGSVDKVDIILNGLGIQDRHAGISFENDNFFLEPFENARIMRNGKQFSEKFELNNFDRLVFGASLYYLFVNPYKFEQDSQTVTNMVNTYTVDKIQQEIAEESGLITNSMDHKNPDEIACFNNIIDLMPSIEEANEMSILMDKKIKYSAIILNPIVIGDPYGKVKPFIEVKKFGTNNEWLWSADKFIDRKAFMADMYLDLKENGKIDPNKFKDFDPFFDKENEPVLIGIAVAEPRCVLHRIPFDDNPKIFDYRKKLIGTLHVELIPCDKQGIAFDNIENSIIQNPEKDLKNLYFLIRISNIRCMSIKYKKIFCQFKIYNDQNYSKSQVDKDDNSQKVQFQKLISFDNVDQNIIKYFQTYPIFIQVYGIHSSNTNESSKMTTKQWFEKEKLDKSNSSDSIKEELSRVQTDLDKVKLKLKNLETLLNFAEKKNKRRIKVEYVRECMLSNHPDVLAKLYDLIDKSKDGNSNEK